VTASAQAVSLALSVAEAATEKLASDIVVIDVSERLVITDCFVLASAPSERQTRRKTTSETSSRGASSSLRAA
jgi:ribosome-associated protein